MTLGSAIMGLVVIVVLVYWWNNRHDLHEIMKASPKVHKHDRLRFVDPPPRKVRHQPTAQAVHRVPGVKMDENDLAELDGMFGKAGDSPADYR